LGKQASYSTCFYQKIKAIYSYHTRKRHYVTFCARYISIGIEFGSQAWATGQKSIITGA
jgi:hypothetical protein